MGNNERLAEIIAEKLTQKGLLKEGNSDFKRKLSKGDLKEVDWKFLLESALEKSAGNPQGSIIENVAKDETE